MATVREIAKTTFTGSKSFRESKNNKDTISIIIGKIIFNGRNNFSRKKKNKPKITFINIIITMLAGETKIASRTITMSKNNKNAIFFTKVSLATIIFINYNNKL